MINIPLTFDSALRHFRALPTAHLGRQVLRFCRNAPRLYERLSDDDQALLRYELIQTRPVDVAATGETPEADHQKELAEYYAQLWNELAVVGLEPSEAGILRVADELSGGNWVLYLDEKDEQWKVIPAEKAPNVVKYFRDRAPWRFAAERSPKGGVSVAGKWFPGGQWIPSSMMDKADPLTKQKILASNQQHAHARRSRGPVNTSALNDKLAPHKDHATQMTPAEQKRHLQQAKRSFNALMSHHGELVVHRLEELANSLHEAIDQTPKEETGIRDHFSKRLNQIGQMLEWAKAMGHTGQVAAPKKETQPATSGGDETKSAGPFAGERSGETSRGLKGSILGYLTRTKGKSMPLSALRQAMGEKSFDASKPMASATHQAVKDLLDAGKLDVHMPPNGEASVRLKGTGAPPSEPTPAGKPAQAPNAKLPARLPLPKNVHDDAHEASDRHEIERAIAAGKRVSPEDAAKVAPKAAAPAPAVPEQKRPWEGGDVKHDKVYMAPTEAMLVDPIRFQFKMNTDQSGVTQELKSVKKFNPELAGVISVWKDPADGRTYIVNGHHRKELAARTGHPALAVRYLQAKDAKEARAKGALINIAEGRGTAMDAAKFMRDTGISAEDVAKEGVSLKGQLAADAVILTKLNDRLFDRVARGLMEPEKGKAIAEHLQNPELQDQLAHFLDKKENEGKDYSARTISEMAREFAATPTTTREGTDLFGCFANEESLFAERNELKSHVRAELSKEVNDFLAVANKKRAERVGAGGKNILDPEANKKIAQESERVRNVFDTLVNRKGPISDAINESAKAYAAAKTRKDKDGARKQALNAVRDAVFTEAGVGVAKNDAGGENGVPPERQEGPGSTGAARTEGQTTQPRGGDSAPAGLTPDAEVPDNSPQAQAEPHPANQAPVAPAATSPDNLKSDLDHLDDHGFVPNATPFDRGEQKIKPGDGWMRKNGWGGWQKFTHDEAVAKAKELSVGTKKIGKDAATRFPAFAGTPEDQKMLAEKAPAELKAWRDAAAHRATLSPSARAKFWPVLSKAHDALKAKLADAKRVPAKSA